MDFWKWAGMTCIDFSNIPDVTTTVSPFYFPDFDRLRGMCKQIINQELSAEDIDDFLTCLALDSEEELLLSWCIETGNDVFIDTIIKHGSVHLQPEARWQIAELIRVRYTNNRLKFLQVLCNDSNAYVKNDPVIRTVRWLAEKTRLILTRSLCRGISCIYIITAPRERQDAQRAIVDRKINTIPE